MRQPARTPVLRRAARLAALSVASLLAACGDGPNDPRLRPPSTLGASRITSSGAATVSDTGIAFYGDVDDEDDVGFTLAMASLASDSSFENLVMISRRQPGAPGRGTYALHDPLSDEAPPADAVGLAAVLATGGAQPRICVATSGSMTVASASAGRIGGHYRARATCSGPDDVAAGEADISGTFDAVDAARVGRLPRGARQVAPPVVARLSRAGR